MAERYWATAQISTYNSDMHRVQFTQLTITNKKQLTKEVGDIFKRYPDAFSTSIYIEYRPKHEWPKKWREV